MMQELLHDSPRRRHVGRRLGRPGPSAARGSILTAALVACLAAVPAPAPGQEPAAAAVRERNVIRKQLPKHVKSIALEYTVIAIDETGKEKSVDPATHTFKVGDSFLDRIRPQDDVHV